LSVEFIECAAVSARDNVGRMTTILRKQVTGEKIVSRFAIRAFLGFDPHKILDPGRAPAESAHGSVVMPDLLFHLVGYFVRRPS